MFDNSREDVVTLQHVTLTRRTFFAALSGILLGHSISAESLPIEVGVGVPFEFQAPTLDAINEITLRYITRELVDNIFAGSLFFTRVRYADSAIGNFYRDDEQQWKRFASPGQLRLNPARLPQ